MPSSLVGAALFVLLVLPGYLFQNGYREHCYVRRPDRDLYAIAQPIGISAVLLCAISAIIGILDLDRLADELFSDDFHDGLNPTQSVAVVLAVLLPYGAGRLAGKLVARRKGWIGRLLRPHPPGDGLGVALADARRRPDARVSVTLTDGTTVSGRLAFAGSESAEVVAPEGVRLVEAETSARPEPSAGAFVPKEQIACVRWWTSESGDGRPRGSDADVAR